MSVNNKQSLLRGYINLDNNILDSLNNHDFPHAFIARGIGSAQLQILGRLAYCLLYTINNKSPIRYIYGSDSIIELVKNFMKYSYKGIENTEKLRFLIRNSVTHTSRLYRFEHIGRDGGYGDDQVESARELPREYNRLNKESDELYEFLVSLAFRDYSILSIRSHGGTSLFDDVIRYLATSRLGDPLYRFNILIVPDFDSPSFRANLALNLRYDALKHHRELIIIRDNMQFANISEGDHILAKVITSMTFNNRRYDIDMSDLIADFIHHGNRIITFDAEKVSIPISKISKGIRGIPFTLKKEIVDSNYIIENIARSFELLVKRDREGYSHYFIYGSISDLDIENVKDRAKLHGIKPSNIHFIPALSPVYESISGKFIRLYLLKLSTGKYTIKAIDRAFSIERDREYASNLDEIIPDEQLESALNEYNSVYNGHMMASRFLGISLEELLRC